MIPLRDVIPSRTTPWVTIALISVNVAVFVYELSLPPDALSAFFLQYGLVPADFALLNVVTSMFLHAGWLHAGGNLLSLWIFGDNVEDQLGHGRFLAFYLLTGLAAAMAETWARPDAVVPLVGASGAIAGVMGAYLVMFPHSRILVLVFLVIFVDVVEIPAVFFLTLWFLLQILGGVGQLADTGGGGGIAFWAHAGGFLTGLAGVGVLRRRRRRGPDRWNA